MSLFKHLAFAFAWIAYLIFSSRWFPVWNIHSLIPHVFLVALTTWLYGKTAALYALLFHMIYHALLTDYHGDIVNYHNEAKITGYALSLTVTYIASALRADYNQITSSTTHLEQLIKERTAELHEFTKQLIDSDEEIRVALAQDIHDGLGQHLTGLLLYSSALKEKLSELDAIEQRTLDALVQRAQNNLQLARKISRMLFPIKISETGIKTAVSELADYFSTVHDIQFETHIDTASLSLDPKQELYLYRIICGAIRNEVDTGDPHKIMIILRRKQACAALLIRIDRSRPHDETALEESMEMKLIRYRANEIGARLVIDKTGASRTRIECMV